MLRMVGLIICFTRSIRDILRTLFENRNKLLVSGLLSIVFLFVLHSIVTTGIVHESIVQDIILTTTIILLFLVGLSVVWAGALPMGISILGVVLIFTGIALPFYGIDIPREGNFKGIKILVTQESIIEAADAYFFLGISMLFLSIIIAFKPRLLYTKNRPEPMDSIWDNYQIWNYDPKSGNESVLSSQSTDYATQLTEPIIPIKTLMNEKEKYLLWRYEYVLVLIYGHPYLVEIHSEVPVSSQILRDSNGRMIGKSKYPGYFV